MTQAMDTRPCPQSEKRTGTLLQEWISRAELAQELGVCVETLRRWADARRGPAFVRAGRKILYRRSSVLKWLEEQETGGQPRERRGMYR